MKKILIALCMIGMVGCMASSLENQKPIYAGHTQKDVDAVNRCLSPKWVELRPSSSSIPTETGYKITASDDIFGALAIAKVDKSGTGGSDVAVYAVAKGWNDHWGSAARSCM
nr:hypothetical protein [Pantoea sp. 201603H]